MDLFPAVDSSLSTEAAALDVVQTAPFAGNGLGDRTSSSALPGTDTDAHISQRVAVFAQRRERRNGTGGDDRIVARGDTTVRGRGGDDLLIARKTGNILLGGGGSDTLNSKRGRGDNELKGGGGADELISGGRDDVLIGGGGSDRLVIADGRFNRGISIIRGFKANDTIVIRDVNRADSVDDLTFRRQKRDTLIQVGRRTIARVERTRPNVLRNRADNFVFSDNELNDNPIVPPTPSTPTLSINDRTITEGDSGSVQAIFTVSLSQPTSDAVTVDVAIAPGTATLGIDVAPVNTTLTFAPGTQTQTVSVPVLGDILDEFNETFTVSLANATNATIADGVGLGTIVDNETALTTRAGNVYSQSAQNQETLESQFETYTINRNGQQIVDWAPTDPRLGIFVGAIENFRTVDGKLKVVRDDGGDPTNDDVVTENGFAVLSDTVPLVIRDTQFEVGNLEAKLVDNAPLFGNRTVIEYTIYTGSGASREGVRTMVLDIDSLGNSSNPTDPFGDFPTRSLPLNFNRDLAINSLSYILDNHLLGLAVPLLDEDNNGILAPEAVDIILQDTVQDSLSASETITRRLGNRYSRTGQNQTGITRLFDVVNVNSSDQFIQDQVPGDANTGLFIDAVRDFVIPTGGQLQQSNTFGIALDSDGNPILNPADPITATTTVFAIGNLEATLVENSSDFDGRDIIEYTLFEGQGAARIDRLTIALDFNDVDLFGLFPVKELPQPFDLDQAINSITYIIENDLLSLAEPEDPNLGGLKEVLALEPLEV